MQDVSFWQHDTIIHDFGLFKDVNKIYNKPNKGYVYFHATYSVLYYATVKFDTMLYILKRFQMFCRYPYFFNIHTVCITPQIYTK